MSVVRASFAPMPNDPILDGGAFGQRVEGGPHRVLAESDSRRSRGRAPEGEPLEIAHKPGPSDGGGFGAEVHVRQPKRMCGASGQGNDVGPLLGSDSWLLGG